MKIVNVEQMHHIEQAADAQGHSYDAMMDMAGRSVAETAQQLILNDPDQNVLVLVGPGNNGGDGLVTARYLLDAGQNVTVYVWKRKTKGDANFGRLKRRRRGVSILWSDNDADYKNLREEIGRADLVIDALLGTGVARPIDGPLAELLGVVKEEITRVRSGGLEEEPAEELMILPRFPIAEAQALGVKPDEHKDSGSDDEWDDDWDDDDEFAKVKGLVQSGNSEAEGAPDSENDLDWDDELDDDYDDWDSEDELTKPRWPVPTVLAVDCPSGLNCDTGSLDAAALPADVTVTFAYPKWGQLEYPGAGACGLLAVAGIGVRPEFAVEVKTELVDPPYIQMTLPRRPQDANKGTFGKAMVVAGSLNYTGAPFSECRGGHAGRRRTDHRGDPGPTACDFGRRAA